MLDILIISGDASALPIEAPPVSLLHRSAVVTPVHHVEWRPSHCPSIVVYAFGADVSPSNAKARTIAEGNELAIFNGWAIPGLSGACFVTATEARKHKDSVNSWIGEFMALFVDQYGNGALHRNLLASVQLYIYSDAAVTLISTRPSIIAAYLGNKRLNVDFARWAACYAIPMTSHSIFDGVNFLPPGTSIEIRSGRVIACSPNVDIVFDPDLADRYRSNRSAYWDEVYESLMCLLRVADVTSDLIDFPISGGKDSRLLLGLLIGAGYGNKIRGAFTNGPEFSPEVTSGRMVADRLGVAHRNVWSGTTHKESIDGVADKLLKHLFITEGEMSPVDLTYTASVMRKFTLTGQEAGLRNISLKRDVSTMELLHNWMRVHLGAGNFLLTEAAVASCRADIACYLDKMIAEGTPFAQAPTRHRIEFRGSRWVSRTWGVFNRVCFSPQVFRSEIITKATYNAGPRSRQLEEFHYEMLRRVDPALLAIPFSGQVWDPELGEVINEAPPFLTPLEWPEGITVFSQRGMFGVMKENWSNLKSFILNNASPALSTVIDLEKIAGLSSENIEGAHVQRLWQVVQCVLFESAPDFSDLRDGSGEDMFGFSFGSAKPD